jgi:hypothetical protein
MSRAVAAEHPPVLVTPRGECLRYKALRARRLKNA